MVKENQKGREEGNQKGREEENQKGREEKGNQIPRDSLDDNFNFYHQNTVFNLSC